VPILSNLSLFDETIVQLEERPVTTGKILFYGSSTITVWGHERLESQMQGLGEAPVTVNHGFGGSTAEQALYYYGRMVRPYAPRAFVWYEGDNDIKQGYTPGEAFALSLRVFAWLRKDFPACRIFLLSTKYCPSRKDKILQYKEYNDLLRTYAEETENCAFIDLRPMLYENPGDIGNPDTIRTDIFLPDMLHFNEQGYIELAAIVRKALAH